MKLLITGDTGFIGKHILPYLPLYCEPYFFSKNKHNIHDCALVTKILQEFRPTHCLHLAWYAGQGYAQTQENVDWTHASMHLIREFYAQGGQRFVGIGSCFEYAHTEAACAEYSTPTVPKTTYGYAKLCIATYLQAFCNAQGLPYAWCRPFYILGPGEAPHRLIPSACAHFLRNDNFSTVAYNTILDYMDVRDVARALVTVLISPYNGIVNIATGHGVMIGDMLHTLKTISHSQSKIIAGIKKTEPTSIIANIDIIQTQIQFIPQFTLQQSLTDCYQDVKNGYNHEHRI